MFRIFHQRMKYSIFSFTLPDYSEGHGMMLYHFGTSVPEESILGMYEYSYTTFFCTILRP